MDDQVSRVRRAAPRHLKRANFRTGWIVYLVECRNGTYYTGSTNDLERRIRLHNAGRGARYTRAFGPVRLLWKEEQPGCSEALQREAEIKSWPRPMKEKLIRAAHGAAKGKSK